MASGGALAAWLGAVNAIPGAIKAISQLVIGTADLGVAGLDVGKAKLQQVAQGIRDDTAAKSKVAEALASAASLTASTDDARVQRSLTRWLDEQERKQSNRESVARKTIEHLNEEPPPKDTAGPDEDWMNVFARHAEDASSERFQETWARILAGEIRKPGSFSLRTLHFISTLDKKLAETVLALAGTVLGESMIPIYGPFKKGEHYTQLLKLTEAGFLTLGSARYYTIPQTGSFSLTFGKKRNQYLIFTGVAGRELGINGALLTQCGEEILRVIDYDGDEQVMTEVAADLAKSLKVECKFLRAG